MTRRLPHLWEDPLPRSLNEETDRLFTYHQATKHTYQSVRLGARSLDWNNQPNPFRIYESSPCVKLPLDPGFPDTGTFAAIAAIEAEAVPAGGNESDKHEEIQLDMMWLSRLLWHSMAISAWKKVPGSGNRYSLRVNPSSGNLHPTETYLALHEFMDIADGLYHYRADTHALELRSLGPATTQLAQALMLPSAGESPLVVGLTSIFWREAWKYGDRAYRYCCHDAGHAMMSLLLAARALGLPGSAVARFADARLTHALGLNESDEAPMAFLVFPSRTPSAYSSPQPEGIFIGNPNKLSAQERPYERLLDIHRATILPDSWSPSPMQPAASTAVAGAPPASAKALARPEFDAPLAEVVRRRRSALDFDAPTSFIDRKHLEQLLDFATREWPADYHGTSRRGPLESGNKAGFVTLYLYLHRVRDCDSGVYRWNRTTGSLEQLHLGNVERVAAYLSLEQALAGNGCFTVSMIANLAKAAQDFGNRGYRYVHFEAGAIGQRLYVGAEALNWNATGIGAFYDDDVHRYLGFLEETDNAVNVSLDAAERRALVMLGSPTSRLPPVQDLAPRERTPLAPGVETVTTGDSKMLARQVIYHFAVGRAVPDPRLDG